MPVRTITMSVITTYYADVCPLTDPVFYSKAYSRLPEFRKRMSSRALKEQKDEQNDKTVEQRLGDIETELKEMNEKISRDYVRLNNIDRQIDRTKAAQADVMDELGIIMQALLGVLRGMQEQGTNGPTAEAEKKINDYLNQKAHRNECDD